MSHADYFDSIRIAPRKSKPAPVDHHCGKYTRKRHGGPFKGAPARDEICAFVRGHEEKTGGLPSVEQIRDAMGWRHCNSVRDCLRKCSDRLGADLVRRLLG